MEITDLTAVLVALATTLIVYFLWSNRRPSGLPPGPTHIPFIGSIFSLTDEVLPKLFFRWKDSYGSIFSFSIGNTHQVVLNDFAAVKEGLVTLDTQIAGRPDVHGHVAAKLKVFSPKYPVVGIADSNYSDEWKKQRSTAVQILRSFGFSKHAMETKISEEVEILRGILHKQDRKPIDPEELLMISISNNICSLMYGQRYEHDDPEFQELIMICAPLIKAFFDEGAADFIPLLRLRPAYHRNLDIFKDTCQQLNRFNLRKIEERKAELDQQGIDEPKDFIEAYLKELRGEGKGRLTDDWLIPILDDFLLGAGETTASTLQWTLLRMAVHTHVQRKVHEELDRVIGQDHHVFQLSDRDSLPYTIATVMEAQRMNPVFPLSLPHATTKDVNMRGFHLPRGTVVLCNLYGAMNDPKVFDEPNKMKPERFLDADGKLTRIEEWIPFSMGRRMCLGEQLARQELFLFFASIMQSFTVSFPDGVPPPNLDGRDAGFWKPIPFEVVFTPRL